MTFCKKKDSLAELDDEIIDGNQSLNNNMNLLGRTSEI